MKKRFSVSFKYVVSFFLLALFLTFGTGYGEAIQLDRDHPLYAIPTTGALVGDELYYIATAQFDTIDEDGDLAPWEDLSDTIILKLMLD